MREGRLVVSVGTLAAGLLVIGVALASATQDRGGFPHEEHEGLFPLCAGCHTGIERGVEAARFPDPDSCRGCHDGEEVERISWTGPSPRVSNLAFDHTEHVREVAEEGADAVSCTQCHTTPAGTRLSIEPLQAETCLTCHGETGEHVQDAPCAVCHVPLAETSFGALRVQALEVPPDHDLGAFLAEAHGELVVDASSRCATCHTRERCTACHVDAGLEQLALVPAASPTLSLPPGDARYPEPPSHRSPDFESAHGFTAVEGGAGECSTCHTRDDCASCHLPPIPEPGSELPTRAAALAPGVGLTYAAPASHESASFMDAHSTLASADPGSCASCHTDPFCTACHDAPATPGFHDEDYVVRHAADAWSQNGECASCHNVQAFCRSCHVDAGFESSGRLGQGYHDAEPVWLLRHGQAARQSLESCASCHSQRDCLGCHSEIGAFQINPHGRDFDARRAWERNPSICFACHLQSPFGRG